ncbi:MAG: DUF1700 domain-containing protein [Armatimonadetes bacterium]|nr:DUF1700 domain-containing protein [Armatimonadota bacterium]
MNREQFLSQLRLNLGNMPDADKQDILFDYEEHFRIGLTDGKSEEQIAESLGNPRVIGNSYRIDAMLSLPKEGGDITAASVSRAVFASISLTFFNIIFVLGPFFGLLGVLFGMWATAVSLTLAGVGLAVSPIWPGAIQFIANPLLNGAFVLFSGIGIAALGVLASIGMSVLTKWFFIGVAVYVKFNARIIRGEK